MARLWSGSRSSFAARAKVRRGWAEIRMRLGGAGGEVCGGEISGDDGGGG